MTTPSNIASARPRKRFFVDTLVRDISLVDCILDLVDNSIDGYLRTTKTTLNLNLLVQATQQAQHGRVDISISPDFVEVSDNCGGIPRDQATADVFTFGHQRVEDSTRGAQLGAYGIGLKRAIFKLGKKFAVTSIASDHAFEVRADLPEWLSKDDSLDDWAFPLFDLQPPDASQERGTRVVVRDLHSDISELLRSPAIIDQIARAISETYCLLLSNCIEVYLNGKKLLPVKLVPSSESFIQPSMSNVILADVQVDIVCTLWARTKQTVWEAKRAGWYVFCNGRAVLSADRTDVSGWGTASGMPLFHSSKHRGFLGLIFFSSPNTLSLPWTTTKRGLNRESSIFLQARRSMIDTARPILSFLDTVYQEEDEDGEREVIELESLPAASIKDVFAASRSSTPGPTENIHRRTVTRVQYDIDNSLLEKIRDHFQKSKWPASRIGEFALDYMVRKESIK